MTRTPTGVTATVIVPAGFFKSGTCGDSRERITEREIHYFGGRPYVQFYGRWMQIRRPSWYSDQPAPRYYVAVPDGTPLDAKVTR